MTNEIVKMVAKKANIPEIAAQVAVTTVITALKSKLPASLSGTLDALLGNAAALRTTTAAKKTTATAKKTTTTAKKSAGSSNTLENLGTIAGALGGLLGKK